MTPQEWRPTGIHLGILLFNIYTSELPNTVSRKYAYPNDLAIIRADGDWHAVVSAHQRHGNYG